MIDTGSYNKKNILYKKLMEDLYAKYSEGIKLSPEYAYFVKENMLNFFFRLARYKFVARLLKKTDCVLDVGCGSGLGSIFISQHCRHVTGLDVKLTEIEEARLINKRDNVEFVVKDFFKMKVLKKHDVIVALDVIEHMTVKSGQGLIRTMANHLTPAGMIIIGTPSLYSYKYQGKLSKASHVKCYEQQELLFLIDKNFGRTVAFSMNDELVHTGFSKLAWYYFVLGFMPKGNR